MASFMAAQLPSDDEEDLDFNPDVEVDTDEEDARKKALKSKKNASVKKRGRGAGGIGFDENEEEEEESDAEEEGDCKRSGKEQAEAKAKADDVWAVLQGKRDVVDEIKAKKSGRGTSVAALEAMCHAVEKSSSSKGKKKMKNGNRDWMKQLGLAGGKKKNKSKDSGMSTDEIAQKALAAVKDATASSLLTNMNGMITIEETRRFAGQNITVQREVEKDSKAAKRSTKPKKEGLDAVLEQIAPTKKVTVMDKSKSDWKDFKSNDDRVLEELEAHKKSGGTFLEKKDFLAAADLKAYEKERDARLGSDVRNRGRL